MTKPPRRPGIEEFYQQVLEAAGKDAQNKRKHNRSPAQKEATQKMRAARRRIGNPNIVQQRRKCAGKRSDGGKCNAPAVRGSDYCHRHGGRKDNPSHPGNIARLHDGRLGQWAEANRAKRVWMKADPEQQRAVLQYEAPCPDQHCRAPHWINKAEGVKAHRAAQRGEPTQWAQWIANQKHVAQQYKDMMQNAPTFKLFNVRK